MACPDQPLTPPTHEDLKRMLQELLEKEKKRKRESESNISVLETQIESLG